MRRKYDVSNRAFNVYTNQSVKCKHCGHSVLFGFKERIICNHCGHYIYRNSKIEFKHRLRKERMKTLTE